MVRFASSPSNYLERSKVIYRGKHENKARDGHNVVIETCTVVVPRAAEYAELEGGLVSCGVHVIHVCNVIHVCTLQGTVSKLLQIRTLAAVTVVIVLCT